MSTKRDELVDYLADELHEEIIRQRKYVPSGETGEAVCMKLDLALLAEKAIDVVVPHLSRAMAVAVAEETEERTDASDR